MPMLSDYEVRTSWKRTPPRGRFPTHPSLVNKVDGEGRFRFFPGSTVVFRMDERAQTYLASVDTYLRDHLGNMLAAPLHPSSAHVTLHDLVSPELARSTAIFSDPEHRHCTPEYLGEVDASLHRAAEIVDALRREHAGEHIEMLADHFVNMTSKSLVLMLKPAAEQDFALLDALYRRFDDIVTLPYPLTPHVTIAYFRPGEIDGDALAEALGAIQVNQSDPMRFTLCVDSLFAQRFFDMERYADAPPRLMLCCDGGLNRSVMAAALLNQRARERNLELRCEARSASQHTAGAPIPLIVFETLAKNGVSTDGLPDRARYFTEDDRTAFSGFALLTEGTLIRAAGLGVSRDKFEEPSRYFYGIPDPQYESSWDKAYREIEKRVDRFLDDFAAGRTALNNAWHI